MKISVQTLFLPRESIFYMEEWLLYHTLLGFDKFRLYDNTGSSGDISSPFRLKYGSTLTKYGLPLVSDETGDEEIGVAIRNICEKFNVDLVVWPSANYTNEVQMSAIKDHCRNDDSDYTAFIDMDEYVVIGGGMTVEEFMKKKVIDKGFCGVRMSQQKMPHILKAKMLGPKYVWELADTFRMNTRDWAPKNILPTKDVIAKSNVHELSCGGMLLNQPDKESIKINHYNTNEYQMWWLKRNYKKYDKETPFERMFLGESEDYSLNRFKEKMSQWDYLNLEEI